MNNSTLASSELLTSMQLSTKTLDCQSHHVLIFRMLGGAGVGDRLSYLENNFGEKHLGTDTRRYCPSSVETPGLREKGQRAFSCSQTLKNWTDTIKLTCEGRLVQRTANKRGYTYPTLSARIPPFSFCVTQRLIPCDSEVYTAL